MRSSTARRPDIADRARTVALPPGGFDIGRLNAHYEGAYQDKSFQWRRRGARDKAENIRYLCQRRRFAPRSVLEVGCGTGAVLAMFAESGVGTRHVGVDLADPRAHADPLALEVGVDLLPYDGVRLPFPDGAFDLVIATHVVEHVEHPRQFLRELSRVSSELMYLEVPCEMNLTARRSGLVRALAIGHINHFTPESFTVLRNSVGLRVDEAVLFDHSHEVISFGRSRARASLLRVLRRGSLMLFGSQAARLFTYHYAVLARKGTEICHL